MNKLIEKFGSQKRWVNWEMVERDGKATKIPLIAGTGKKMASSSDPKTWSKYHDLDLTKGVGIMFGLKGLFLGVDIDKCLKNGAISHEQGSFILDFILESNTYTEISPSGNGIHLYFELTEPLILDSNKKAPFEAYTMKRFFTVTGVPFGVENDVRTVTPEEALKLLSIIGYPWKSKEMTPVAEPSKSFLKDDEVISKMFSSRGGAKLKKLWNGDTSLYKNDESSADLALLSHLAFWTGGDDAQMERLWLSSPLGTRGKTKERKDYRDRSIAVAKNSASSFYKPVTKKEKEVRDTTDDEELDLLFTVSPKGDKVFSMNVENVCRILRKDKEFAGIFRIDEFRDAKEILVKGKWRGFIDSDAIAIQTRLSVLYPFLRFVSKSMVYDAIMLVMQECKYDSAVDYLKSVTWDGKPRLDTWLCSVYGVLDTEYFRKVGSNWMKGMVKRIIEPGCKFDYVLVLEGEQGSKKSTSLSVLGGPWHVETVMTTDSKDFYMQMLGKAIIEFSEGETLSRTEVKRMKAIITTQIDKYRPPYERESKEFPRRCVFAMTTNQEEYLKDETGNRRWLPVRLETENADIEWLKENRDQLFAEAYHRVAVLNETVYEFPEEETRAQQVLRKIHDPNSELVEDWYHNILTDRERDLGITIYQVFGSVFSKFGGKMTKSEEMSIAGILKDYLKLFKKRTMINSVQSIRWYKNEESANASELLQREVNFNEF